VRSGRFTRSTDVLCVYELLGLNGPLTSKLAPAAKLPDAQPRSRQTLPPSAVLRPPGTPPPPSSPPPPVLPPPTAAASAQSRRNRPVCSAPAPASRQCATAQVGRSNRFSYSAAVRIQNTVHCAASQCASHHAYAILTNAAEAEVLMLFLIMLQ
jgi:hypothetical protein